MILFDLIVSNPPFEDSVKRKKTPHKLWIDFTHKEISLLSENGELAQISPNSFLSPSSKILPYFTKYVVKNLNLDTGSYFDVGSTFADYNIIKRENNGNKTVVIDQGSQVDYFNFSNNLQYIPNDFCATAISIHTKVIFNSKNKLNVKYDYVTCHNVQLKDDNSPISKTQNTIFKYPIFHTNPQIWYSKVKQDFADKKKVMWTRSGYTKPFYDDGKLGGTDMAYYVLVSSEEEGNNLVNNLNTQLFEYIFATARWSGFGNELVFKSIPDLPKDKTLSDQEMFALFNLTDKEIEYVNNYKKKNKKEQKESTDGGKVRDKDRVKVTAEVFTSNELADRLISQCEEKWFTDSNVKILEPSAGNGQLVMAILRKMKSLGRNDWEHILSNQLFIVEYMEDNILDMINKISQFTGLSLNNISHNIVFADFLYFTDNNILTEEMWKSNRYLQGKSLRIQPSEKNAKVEDLPKTNTFDTLFIQEV